MLEILILSIFIGIFSYYLYHWTYWLRRGIPGPLGVPIIGVANTMLSSDFPPYLRIKEWGKIYGPVFGITEGFNKSLVISDKELIHEVFVKQFDNFYGRKLNAIHGNPEKDHRVNLFMAQGFRWKRLRSISSPTFSNNSLRKINNTVEECSMELLRHIDEQTADGKQIDMLQFYQEFTLDVIGRIAMGQTDSQLFHNPLFPFVRAIFGESRKKLLMMGCTAPTFTRFFRFLVDKFPGFFPKNPAGKIMENVGKAVKNRIKMREEDEKNGIEIGEAQDFIDLFLDARSDNDNIISQENEDFSRNSGKISKKLTISEIMAQCFVFIVAGFDTTALSLSFATWLLAMNPRVQKKLQEEIDKECPDPDISFDQLAKLKYMESVIKETLRLYPLAAPANTRKCMKDTVIGEGIRIEKGTHVIVNTWELHRDPKIWGDDAEEFKPERWETLSADQKGYIPFGLGPRQCIGMRLAYMEEKMLLAHILRKYSFETGQKTQIPMKLVGRATTQPESVWMHLKRRD